jgi:hypothetical protein
MEPLRRFIFSLPKNDSAYRRVVHVIFNAEAVFFVAAFLPMALPGVHAGANRAMAATDSPAAMRLSKSTPEMQSNVSWPETSRPIVPHSCSVAWRHPASTANA